MRYTTNAQEIEKILVGRTAVEQELALDLSKVFATGVLCEKINAGVVAAFQALKGLKESDPNVLKPKIEKLEADNDFLFDKGRNKVEKVLEDYGRLPGRTLTPEQCGNLIRFYGEVVEALASYSFHWKQERMKQISWRYGGGGETFKTSWSIQQYERGAIQEKDVHVAEADQGSVWRKDKWLFSSTAKIDGKKVPVPKSVAHWEQKPDQSRGGVLSWQKSVVPAPDAGPGGRRRGSEKAKDDEGKPKDTYFAKAGQQKKPNPFYDIIPGNLFINAEAANLHIGKKFGGAMEWKIQDTSTIGVIDRVFGLPYGADISGTTADELYFLTGCTDINSGDPVMKMLPLAVIVGEYHHTLLEVAAAMSLKRVINYQIGFYRTLLPSLPPGIPAQEQRANIEQLLSKCENDPRNVHILLHYNGNQKIAGGFIAEHDDLGAFRKLGTVDIHLWPQFNGLPAYPPEDKIIGLLNGVGLGNAVLESRRKALRGEQASADREVERLERTMRKFGKAA